MIRHSSNRVIDASRNWSCRAHSISSKDASKPLSVSSSPFKSQELSAAAQHRAKRLNEVQKHTNRSGNKSHAGNGKLILS